MVFLALPKLYKDPIFSGKLAGIHYEANCALSRRAVLCLYAPGFQIQVFKHDKILSEQSKKLKKQKKNKGRVLASLQFTKCTVWPRKLGS